MSRQICKSKQVPRIFQHRNQSPRSVVRNVVWASSEPPNTEGDIVSPQASSYSDFHQEPTDSSAKHFNHDNEKRSQKIPTTNFDYSTKILNDSISIEDPKIGETSLEKNTSNAVDDIEKWLKTRTESVSSIELDSMKSVVEAETEEDRSVGVDGYLGDDLPHAFLGKAPDGLSLDIDFSDKKMNLDYDPLLRELQSHKLLEACDKNDEYIIPDFRLDHLDPLVLSPHDMMVAGEILPSASHPAVSHVALQENIAKSNAARIKRENSLCPEAEELVDEPLHVDYNLSDNLGKSEETEPQNSLSNNHSLESLSQQIIQPRISQIVDERQTYDSAVKEKIKLKPRIMKQRRKIRPKPAENEIKFLGESCPTDGKDGVMAVVAISTDKISNMTQIVINTGIDEQIYQGKTSELLEATGNFPKISKLEMENGAFSNRDRPHENMVSKALEELGITDESLEPASVNENGRTWLCPWDECNREFGKLHALKTHLLAHFGVRPFKCDFEGCTWAFHSEFKLKRHKETHLKRKNFVCEVPGCNRRFTTIYNLWSHKKLHTRPNRVVCQVPDCHEKFQTKRALEMHMKNHDQSHAPYICNHEGCGKRYYTNNALTSHQRCHNYKEIDVKCSWPGCGKVFDKPCRLKAHNRSHTGSKPYTCTYQDCSWAFTSSSKLKRHQKKHTNERKFMCNVEGCGKAFLRSEHLKEHLLTHAGGGYFQCYMCDAHFSAKSSLYVHIKKHQVKEAVNRITDDMTEVPDHGIDDAEETEENFITKIVTTDEVPEGSLHERALENTNSLRLENLEISSESVKKEREDFSYSCGMGGCGTSFKTLSNLASHMISSHESSIVEDYESPMGISAPSDASDLDYILYATSSANSKSMDRSMLLESCDAIIMSESQKNVACLPEPEPPPLDPSSRCIPSAPLLASSLEENSRLPESSYRMTGDKQISEQHQTRFRKSCQGSARTGLTCEDVWKLKSKVNGTETTNVGATDVVLGEANLNEGLLLTEELPSMFYHDEIGTECQILLLDGASSENPIDLRGLE